ncbi:MAG: hypothetical protein ACKO7B_12390, partial [Flavobacteriales bacterium]
GTRMGLCRTNTRNIDEILDDSAHMLFDDQVLFKTYDTRNGFLGIGCNRGAMQRMSDGTLWVGANELLTTIQTSNLPFDISAPTMSLVGLELSGERANWSALLVNPDSSIILTNGNRIHDARFDSLSYWSGLPLGMSLAFDNNSPTFRFVGITTHQPERVKYSYKLYRPTRYSTTEGEW